MHIVIPLTIATVMSLGALPALAQDVDHYTVYYNEQGVSPADIVHQYQQQREQSQVTLKQQIIQQSQQAVEVVASELQQLLSSSSQ